MELLARLARAFPNLAELIQLVDFDAVPGDSDKNGRFDLLVSLRFRVRLDPRDLAELVKVAGDFSLRSALERWQENDRARS